MKDILESIRKWLNSFKGGEPIEAGGVVVAIEKFNFAKFLAGLIGPLLATAWTVYRNIVANWVIQMAMWVHKSTVRRDYAEAVRGFQDLFDKYLAQDEEWGAAVTAYFNAMLRPEGSEAYPSPTAGGEIEAIGEKWLPEVLNLVLPTGYPPTEAGGGLRPQDGVDGAERFLGMNMRFQFQGTIMQLIADMYGLKNLRALGQFPQNFSWAFGFGWLSWLVMGVPFRLAISEPLERYFQKRYRMKDLTLSQIADLYWSDPTFREEGLTRLQELGYTDDDIARLLNKERYKFSRSELEYLWTRDRISFDDVAAELRASGRSPEQANVLAAMIVNKRYWDLIEDLAGEAERGYKKGTITADELRGYLAAAGGKPDEIELRIARLDLARLEPPEAEPKPTGLTRGMIGGLYRDGLRDWDWTLRKLTGLNWDPSEVDDFRDYYLPKEEKPPAPKRATAAMIGKLYKTRQLTELEARKEWAEAGVIAEDVDLYVKYYAPAPEWPEEFKLPVPMKPATIASLYRRMVITLDEAVYLLSLLDVDLDDAELYLALHAPPETAAPPERPELGVYEIVTAVARELLDMSEGVARLVERGWGADEAYDYLRVQVAYQVAADVWLDCLNGQITYQQAFDRMVAAGWVPRDAEIYLKAKGCE